MSQSSSRFRQSLTSTSGLAILGLLTCGHAQAQVVERHLPPAQEGRLATIVAPNAVPAEQDDAPIGPALRAIVILGPEEAVHGTMIDSIDLSGSDRLTADSGAVKAALKPYLGRVISRKLVAEIEAAIAKHYRDAGYPFVSLSTPEQEITTGIVQIRVVEFKTGSVTVEGGSESDRQYLISQVDVPTGEPINARSLSADLSWLNRYPFRQVQAVFKPGSALGSSDLTLIEKATRPWQAYAGYANSGSESTGRDRFFLGGVIGGALGRDSLLSVQLTGSNDAFGGKAHALYSSQAVSYSLPVGRRKQIEVSLNHVETNQQIDPFVGRLESTELSLGFRTSAWSIVGRGVADVRAGVEAKTQTGTTLFDNVDVYHASMNVYQGYAGYHLSPSAISSLDLVLRVSPGGVDKKNGKANVLAYSQGRETDARYSYVTLAYDRHTRLSDDFTLKTQLSAQWASTALPRSEQIGIGGSTLVRGYGLDEGAFDSGLVVRNEIRRAATEAGAVRISPYGFIDLGHGHDAYTKKSKGVASVGAGASVSVGRRTMLSLDAAYAARGGVTTKSSSTKIEVNLSIAF